jgi:formylglycine-generating enzyme required for sulfatase activity
MRRYLVFGFGLLLGLTAAWAADGPASSNKPTNGPASQPTSAPSPRELEQAQTVFRQLLGRLTDADRIRIEKLAAQLGAESWKDRDKATEALKNEPFAALPLIRQAADSKDPEIAERARTIVSVLESKHLDIALSLRRAIATRKAAKDAAVVGDLIALLQEDNFAVRNTAWDGLLRLTGQDFGYLASTGPDQSRQAARKAQEWWEKNKADFVMKATAGSDEIALDLGGGIKLELVLVPAGKFMMGSPKDEKNRSESEGPQHEVTISRPFYMAIYPVTQEQYEKIIGKNPSHFKGAQNPVENVNWDDAVGFCKTLSQKTGKTVQLPTEAQWEYACRAGSTTRFCYGDDNDDSKLGDYAWYTGNSGGTTHPVGQKKPNDWGLYDMHGNIWQWCSDLYDEKYYANSPKTDPQGPATSSARVLRGGGWGASPALSRSATRGGWGWGGRDIYNGFRVSVALPADPGSVKP